MKDHLVPPGFAPRTSFTLKREEDSAMRIDETSKSNTAVDVSKQGAIQMDTIFDMTALEKVTGRWRPEGAKIDQLKNAPVFYPTQECLHNSRVRFANHIKEKVITKCSSN